VNNVLTVLNKLLKVAVEWRVLPALPCRIRLLKSAKPVVEFYEPHDYERLLAAAASTDSRTHVAALLAGDAGLRLGEILGLEWTDVDFARDLLKVQRAVYDAEVTLPKGGKHRIIPMTRRLAAALQAHRHLRGDRVLYRDDGEPAEKWWLKWALDVAERRAGLRRGGRSHPAAHVLLAPCGAERADAVHQGTRGAHVARDDPAVHAPLRCGAARGDPRPGIWRHFGDGGCRREEAEGRRLDAK
jgi:integrase